MTNDQTPTAPPPSLHQVVRRRGIKQQYCAHCMRWGEHGTWQHDDPKVKEDEMVAEAKAHPPEEWRAMAEACDGRGELVGALWCRFMADVSESPNSILSDTSLEPNTRK